MLFNMNGAFLFFMLWVSTAAGVPPESTANPQEQLPDNVLYKWVDDNGNVHFSDKKPSSSSYKYREISTPKITGVRLSVGGYEAEEDRREEKAREKDSYCIQYQRGMQDIVAHLLYRPNERDRVKLNDLKKQHKLECQGEYAKRDFGPGDCRYYVSELNKAELYYMHTPTDRDRFKVKSLQHKIKSECHKVKSP